MFGLVPLLTIDHTCTAELPYIGISLLKQPTLIRFHGGTVPLDSSRGTFFVASRPLFWAGRNVIYSSDARSAIF
jgi:hypothetical protein